MSTNWSAVARLSMRISAAADRERDGRGVGQRGGLSGLGPSEHSGHVAGVAVFQNPGFGVQDCQEDRGAVRVRNERRRRIELLEQQRRLSAVDQQRARRAAQLTHDRGGRQATTYAVADDDADTVVTD
jgi:hypothetical protein